MPGNDYEFVTHWRVKGTREDVYDTLAAPEDLVRWWPSVYLDVTEISPGDESGIGQSISLLTKGWLPYTLRWQLRVADAERPQGISLDASGDFNGRGVWTFDQDGEYADITYEWNIKADKPILKYLSPLMKPLFSANHRWAMSKGEESLRLELARRQAVTGEDLARVPPPPGPTPSTLLPFASSLLIRSRLSKSGRS